MLPRRGASCSVQRVETDRSSEEILETGDIAPGESPKTIGGVHGEGRRAWVHDENSIGVHIVGGGAGRRSYLRDVRMFELEAQGLAATLQDEVQFRTALN